MPKSPSQDNSSDPMFDDRRVTSRESQTDHHKCRRKNDFGKTESRPWWLKTNYVSQHFASPIDINRSKSKKN